MRVSTPSLWTAEQLVIDEQRRTIERLTKERDEARKWCEDRLRVLAEALGYKWLPGLDLVSIASSIRTQLTEREAQLAMAHVALENAEAHVEAEIELSGDRTPRGVRKLWEQINEARGLHAGRELLEELTDLRSYRESGEAEISALYGECAMLRETLIDLVLKTCFGHSGACCAFVDGRVVVTPESCRCDAISRRVYDAIGWAAFNALRQRPPYDGCAL